MPGDKKAVAQFDPSTFQPLQQNAQSQGQQGQPSNFDASSLQPVQGQSGNPGFQDMMRKIQEMAQAQQQPPRFATAPSSNSDLSSALDSITRMNTGQQMATPQQQQDFQTGKAVGHVSGMGTVAAVSAPAAISALTAPTATTATVGTGLLDAAGNEITKDIIQYGPSLLRQGLPAVAKLAARHPGLTSGGVGYGVLKAMGIDPLDVIREMLTKK